MYTQAGFSSRSRGRSTCTKVTGARSPTYVSKHIWDGIVGAVLRYLDYKFDPQSNIQSFNLNGPLIAATFHW